MKEHIVALVNPWTARDVEVLAGGHCRLHVARRFTIFFDILPDDTIGVFDVTTIEEAHKRSQALPEITLLFFNAGETPTNIKDGSGLKFGSLKLHKESEVTWMVIDTRSSKTVAMGSLYL